MRSAAFTVTSRPAESFCAVCVTLSPVISEGVVLQRDAKAVVWGTAAAGEKVTVTFAGQTVKTTADAFGQWRVKLAPMPNAPVTEMMAPVVDNGLPMQGNTADLTADSQPGNRNEPSVASGQGIAAATIDAEVEVLKVANAPESSAAPTPAPEAPASQVLATAEPVPTEVTWSSLP